MKALLTKPTAEQLLANDTYAGTLTVSIALDEADQVDTLHDLARTILSCTDSPLQITEEAT